MDLPQHRQYDFSPPAPENAGKTLKRPESKQKQSIRKVKIKELWVSCTHIHLKRNISDSKITLNRLTSSN